MEIDVIDNFLPQDQFNHIQDFLMGSWFPWYYNRSIIKEDYSKFQFTHIFYKEKIEPSPFLSLFDNTQSILGVKKLFRIKSNLTVKTLYNQNTGFHIDDFIGSTKTSLLYINTNNGGTKFHNYDIVNSVANRMVIFDSNIEHAGITCTDQNTRVVVNFNYA
jgi:hypothetical protein